MDRLVLLLLISGILIVLYWHYNRINKDIETKESVKNEKQKQKNVETLQSTENDSLFSESLNINNNDTNSLFSETSMSLFSE